jgi:serralysin
MAPETNSASVHTAVASSNYISLEFDRLVRTANGQPLLPSAFDIEIDGITRRVNAINMSGQKIEIYLWGPSLYNSSSIKVSYNTSEDSRLNGHFLVDSADSPINNFTDLDVDSYLSPGTASSQAIGTAFRKVSLDSAFNATLIGNNLDNVLSGNATNNMIVGNLGADTLIGGLGDDTYYVDSFDSVVEEAASGIDTVMSNVTWTAAEHVENIVLLGRDAVNAYGNGLNNQIKGNDNNNLLDGFQGADYLEGFRGNDTYVVDDAGDVVVESGFVRDIDTVISTLTWSLGLNLENLMLAGSAEINAFGNNQGNLITGNSARNEISGLVGNDIINGMEGDDIIDGGAGNDTLNGGLGIDTVRFIDSIKSISIDLISGRAIGDGIDSIQGFENVDGSRYSDTLLGNLANNLLRGFAGNDRLDGSNGNDTLIGGEADDILVGGEGVDTASFLDSNMPVSVNIANKSSFGYGTDTLNSIENVIGSLFADTLIGDNLSNLLDGLAGDDEFIGGDGNDTILGGSGYDKVSYSGSASPITVNLSEEFATGQGTDTLSGIESIIGSNFSDLLIGDSGSNYLVGGAGADVLTGGSGSDTFGIEFLQHSSLSAYDRIVDFSIDADRLDAVNPIASSDVFRPAARAASLTSAEIQRVLPTNRFVARGAAVFTLNPDSSVVRTFIALNDGVAGFNHTTDSLIEITGYTGSISNFEVI